MLLPSIFGESLLDDFMDFPYNGNYNYRNNARKEYENNFERLMKTDVHETQDGYELDIDIPGYKKDEIQLTLEKGYLFVAASKDETNEKKDDKGKVIRKERFSGSMKRSFYIGDTVNEEDIKARFEDGVLKLSIPKKDPAKLQDKKVISIEG